MIKLLLRRVFAGTILNATRQWQGQNRYLSLYPQTVAADLALKGELWGVVSGNVAEEWAPDIESKVTVLHKMICSYFRFKFRFTSFI